ncbi:MAG: ATP-binding protein [Bacteroidales bacterium]|nr:ATP-binding protein [Bacteroidales bacterium]
MNSPFIFGKVATGTSFINRKEEIKRLSDNFQNQLNSILISPRRWGKSSLVKQTAYEVSKKNPGIRFCFLDFFRIRSEEEFYQKFAAEIIKSTSTKFEEWIADAKDFLGRVSPNITFGTDPVNDFQIGFNLSSRNFNAEDILNLPEKIADKKNLNIVVCLDEFQNIGNFSEPLAFQKLLRSVWQYHQKTGYCLYGSKRHMMMELFENSSMPFYKFGDVMFLQKIAREHFVDFIVKSFSETEKSIEVDIAEKITQHVDLHPYFVQQLAHVTWTNTTGKATEEIVDHSVNEMIDHNSMLYRQIVNGLSETQLNLLIAISKGETNLNAAGVLQKFALGTSGNVTKMKRTLQEKEIIDLSNGNITFQDPVFRLWILRMF